MLQLLLDPNKYRAN